MGQSGHGSLSFLDSVSYGETCAGFTIGVVSMNGDGLMVLLMTLHF